MNARKKRIRKTWHFGLVPWLVLMLSLGGTCLACYVVGRISYQRDNSRFAAVAARLQKSIQESIAEQTELGRSLAAFIGSHPDLTKKEYNDVLARMNWPERSPGAGSIGFAVRVQPGNLNRFLHRAAAGGVPHLAVDPSLDTTGGEVVIYRRPDQPGMQPLGVNVENSPVRKAAMWKAVQTGLPQSTGLTSLLQDAHAPRPAVVIAFPIFRTPGIPGTLAERTHALVGFVMMGLRIGEVVRPVFLERDRTSEARFTIFYGAKEDPGNAVFSNANLIHPSRFRRTITYGDLTGVWTILFQSAPEYDQTGADDFSWTIFAGGVIFSFALLAVTGTLARSHSDLESYAAQLEQRAAGERLIARAGMILTEADEFKEALLQIASAAVPDFCDRCSVDWIVDGEIQRLADVPSVSPGGPHPDAETPVLPSLNDEFGAGKALRTGLPELVRQVDIVQLSKAGMSEQRLKRIEALQIASAIIAPIRVLDVPFACLNFINVAGRRRFDESDLALAEEITQRMGLELDKRKLFVAAQQEIASRQAAQEELKKLNNDLEMLIAERTRDLSVAVEELEAFCYSVSHDLRAPLRSVDGFSQALMHDYERLLGEDGADYLHRIRAAAKRMDLLITAMLTLSRLSRAEIARADTDVTQLVEDLIAEQETDLPFRSSVQQGMTAAADPHMIRIAFDNLIANAVKFSSKTEHPLVEVGQKDGVFFVRDNGAGFNPLFSNKLFQPFERLHTVSEFPGTGIGLATVYRVVKRHGGEIWAESQIGKGATFFFTLAPSRSAESTVLEAR